jgi:branched-chain amino acid transport system substrate-binding protein
MNYATLRAQDDAEISSPGGCSVTVTRRKAILASAGLFSIIGTRAHAADTIKIGVVSPQTGAAAESGGFQRNGIKMAMDAINAKGGVLGKQLEMVVADDQTTNPGAVLAFSRLANQPEIPAFIGSIRSTQVQAMAPDILKIGKPTMIGGTDPGLTQMGNPWLFRCRPNDSYSARVIAQFGVSELKKQKWALVYSTDAFGSNGNKALVGALDGLKITPVLQQGYANQQADFTPVVLAIRQSGADVLGTYFTYETDLGVFARQLRQLGVTIPWVGSASIVNISALNLAKNALFGTFGVADYAIDSSPASKAYGAEYEKLFHAAPDNQSSWAYDATNILAMALTKAGGTDPLKVREAIIAIKGYAGAEGTYNFDAKGDGLHGYNVVKNDQGKIVFDKRVDFDA